MMIMAEKLWFERLLRYCCFVLLLHLAFSDDGQRSDVLRQRDERRDESMLTSANGMFTLGIFTPNPEYHDTSYIGIWYGNGSSVPVWIANRNSPFSNHYGSIGFTLDANCSLKIVGTLGSVENGFIDYDYSFSLFDVEEKRSNSCYATLQDDGNFVLREGSTVLWQSFDHPTDTLLHGMKIGINHKTGSTWSLTSWTHWDTSPRTGVFTLTMNPNNTNQLLILLRGEVFWNSGNWQDGGFEFLQQISDNSKATQFEFNLVSNVRETFFLYSSPNLYGSSPPGIENRGLRLSAEGILEWGNVETKVACPYFKNEVEDSWYSGFGYDSSKSDGCVWNHQMPACRIPGHYKEEEYISGEVFVNGSSYFRSENLTRYECKNMCLSDCNCIAYNLTNEDYSCCQLWGRATATNRYSYTLYVLTEDDLGLRSYHSEERRMAVWLQAIIGLMVPTIFLLLCFIIYLKWRAQVFKVIGNIKNNLLHRMKVRSEGRKFLGTMTTQVRDGKKNLELQFFDFQTIVSATNHFADECKLGQGGFGPVYKGVLTDGQEVAIKRLSKNSGQGLVEFKNETLLIAKLQHTNLVRLIGCCIYKEEKLLVYEYMPNKSLDFFLFDSEKKLILDWKRRLHIIQGIVQGLLYLHYYSRVRIIHRDLKASNILLDDEMNAKISDFGMARVFTPSEHEANTSRVVGTYGYISPEYAMEGIFSIKSDVYSFGILLLEIVTSKKNYNNYDTERPLNLTGYAWELWVNGKGEEMIDSSLCNSEEKAKALRCIHASLLCVQQNPTDRPTMLDVFFIINNDSTQLSCPKQPAYFVAQNSDSSELEVEVVNNALIRPGAEPTQEVCSLGTMSVSVMVVR